LALVSVPSENFGPVFVNPEGAFLLASHNVSGQSATRIVIGPGRSIITLEPIDSVAAKFGAGYVRFETPSGNPAAVYINRSRVTHLMTLADPNSVVHVFSGSLSQAVKGSLADVAGILN
jgi:hypothetical protein